MPKQDKPHQNQPRRRPPASTPEARENQMISLAMDLVENRLRNGSASSQETTHFLKLASSKERLEKEILKGQRDLITAKTKQIQSSERVEELYTKALSAMRTYSGRNRGDEDE